MDHDLIGPRAERLWLLERMEMLPCDGHRDVCSFMGAIAILSEGAIAIVFVRSPEADRTAADALNSSRLRLNVARDAFVFGTLDEAMTWAEVRKQHWIQQGWTEIAAESDRHSHVARNAERG